MRALLRLALLLCAWLALSQDTCPATPHPAPRVLHVVTVATDAKNAQLLRAVAHAAVRGVRVSVLESPAGSVGHGVGFGLRLRLVSAFLDAQPAGDVLLFVDAYDVLIFGTPQQLLGAYDEALAAYGAPPGGALFSSERSCWPDKGVAPLYPPHATHPESP